MRVIDRKHVAISLYLENKLRCDCKDFEELIVLSIRIVQTIDGVELFRDNITLSKVLEKIFRVAYSIYHIGYL